MKKRIILISIIAVIAILVTIVCIDSYWVVVDNSLYRITREHGEFYLCFKDSPDSGSPSYGDFGHQIAPDVSFRTVEDMKNDIENGNFTDEELSEIRRFTRSEDDNKKIPVFDITNLWEPELPDSMEVQYVLWVGRSYWYYLSSNNNHHTVWLSSKKGYDAWKDALDSSSWDYEFQYITEDDRNAEVYVDAGKKLQRIYYTIITEDRTIRVCEFYNFKYSSTVPLDIDLRGKCNGYYFHVSLSNSGLTNFTERPSVEWLSQFGIKKFEG